MYTQLNINNFETYFILGNNPEEKLEKRKVVINIAIRFPESRVSACDSDDLRDTVSYSGLLKFILQKLQSAQFNLIEKACGFLYEIVSDYVKNQLAADSQKFLLRVEVIKPRLSSKNLESASFVCSDW